MLSFANKEVKGTAKGKLGAKVKPLKTLLVKKGDFSMASFKRPEMSKDGTNENETLDGKTLIFLDTLEEATRLLIYLLQSLSSTNSVTSAERALKIKSYQ